VSPDGLEEEGDDLVPLSALAHWVVCPRQCCLIHVEQQWDENLATAEGRLLHERVHEQGSETRRGVRVVTGMPLRSRRLGVSGVADLVELHREAGGRWRPFPVEYKRGRPKPYRADEVQLCAQAMALEEMFGIEVPEGALFYGKERRRTPVRIDEDLRALTRRVATEVRAALEAGRTPPPVYEKRRCEGCSLLDLCRPRVLGRERDVALWLARHIEEVG
jgi:CRISPR-associated exonuclease Cas4